MTCAEKFYAYILKPMVVTRFQKETYSLLAQTKRDLKFTPWEHVTPIGYRWIRRLAISIGVMLVPMQVKIRLAEDPKRMTKSIRLAKPDSMDGLTSWATIRRIMNVILLPGNKEQNLILPSRLTNHPTTPVSLNYLLHKRLLSGILMIYQTNSPC